MQVPGSVCGCGCFVVTNSNQGLGEMTQHLNMKHLTICRLAPNPVDDAGLLSFATYSWLTPVMIRSYRHTLTVDTLPPLSPYDSSDTNAKRYQDSLVLPGRAEPTLAKGSVNSFLSTHFSHVEFDTFSVAAPYQLAGLPPVLEELKIGK